MKCSRILFALYVTIIALIIVSCNQTDVLEEQNAVSDEVIGFNAYTTRAGIANIDTIKIGFDVYASARRINYSLWYITPDSANNIYKFFDDHWNWSDGTKELAGHKWPIDKISYPMNFYGLYPINDSTRVSDRVIDELYWHIKINQEQRNQIDYLAAKTMDVKMKPVSGKINLKFEHITSKVNFSVTSGPYTSPFVQQVLFRNIRHDGVFRFHYFTWNPDNIHLNDVFYTYQYWGYETVEEVIIPFNADNKNSTEDLITKMYGDKHDRHLMLRPQFKDHTFLWDGKTMGVTLVDNKYEIKYAYIESVYRLETGDSENAVGYKDAAQHPNFNESEHAYLKGTPLFVKVGLPLNTDFELVQGKAYLFNIRLGTIDSSGGILIDSFYYDEKGNRTNLPVMNVDLGEPINDGKFHFNVDVSPW